MTEYQFEGFNLARDAVHRTAEEKGWWEPQERIVALPLHGRPVTAMVDRTFSDLIALVHSEASEALEDYRGGMNPREIRWQFIARPGGARVERVVHQGRDVWADLYDGAGRVRITALNAAEYGFEAKPHGIPVELADIIIRVLDMCGHYGIDIEAAMLAKAKYNESREHRHGGKKL